MSDSSSPSAAGTTPAQATNPGTYTVQSATSLATAVGVNVATVGTLTGAQLTELGIGTIRTTVTTAAEESALETLAAGGIKFDLVLGQTQNVANFMQYADAINAATLTTTGMQGTMSASVVMVEGPDLTSGATYTYTPVGSTGDVGTTTATGNQAGADASVELFQAAKGAPTNNGGVPPSTAIAGVVVLPYSTVGTADVTSVGSYTSALNVNLGGAPVGEPDGAALSAADQAAVTVGQNYNLPGPLTAVVSQAAASSAGGLLDLLLDTRASVTGTVVTTTTTGTTTATTTATVTAPATRTFFSPLTTVAGTATGTVTAPTVISLYDANGTLTAAANTATSVATLVIAV